MRCAQLKGARATKGKINLAAPPAPTGKKVRKKKLQIFTLKENEVFYLDSLLFILGYLVFKLLISLNNFLIISFL